MKTEKSIFLIIGGITLLVFAAIVFFSINEQKEKTTNVSSYTNSQTNRPKILVEKNSADLGRMKVTDEKSADFMIENSGNKTLQIFGIRTSCDCTFGQVVINNIKSPQFSMHSSSNWMGEIKPKEKATLTAIYRPSIMPVSGDVSREVYVSTNDPDNPKVTFTIKAFVE